MDRFTVDFSNVRPGAGSRVGREVEMLAALLRTSDGDCSCDILLNMGQVIDHHAVK